MFKVSKTIAMVQIISPPTVNGGSKTVNGVSSAKEEFIKIPQVSSHHHHPPRLES